MNEFGFPPNLGGFGRLPEPRPRPFSPPPAPPARSSARLAPLLIVISLLLGAVLSWGLSQRRERTRLSHRNHDLAQAYTVIIAQRDDLAHLLSLPDVRMIHLTGRGQARTRAATIAWSDARRTGFLLAEQMPLLPPGQVYRVWQSSRAGQAIATDRTFQPSPGLTCIEFHLPVSASSPQSASDLPDRFIVTSHPEPSASVTLTTTAQPTGIVIYESDPAPLTQRPQGR